MQSKTMVVLEDRGVISIHGPETLAFLQGLISNDINKVSTTRAIYATLLTPQGKFLHDLFIAAAPESEGILIDCEGDRLDDLLHRLMMYKMRAQVELANESDTFDVVAMFGDEALKALNLEAAPGSAVGHAGGVIFTDPRLAAIGARAVVPTSSGVEALVASGFTKSEPQDYRRRRLEYGLPDGSHDIVVEKYFPLECGFDELHAIDYEKGCYVGQELTARTHHRGKIRKRLMPVVVEGPLPEPGTSVLYGDREIGEIRSGAGNRALALIRIEHFETAEKEHSAFTAGTAKVRPFKPAWARF